MSSNEPSGAAGATATIEAVGERSTAPPNLHDERRWMALDMTQAIASHLPTLQQFASEAIPALREPIAAERGGSTTGERP